ncbi:MAG: hypothetical protein U0132_04330 [Gemmatimonadaceae bacterium]
MNAATENGIVLVGPPRRVTGRVPVALSKSVLVLASVTVGKETTVYRATLRPTGTNSAELRLKLPADTPPGTYVGEATIDGDAHRLQVRVEPVVKISIEPKQSMLAATGSAPVEFGFVIANEGNVPFTVPETDTFDLDDGVAQDKALGRSLRTPLATGAHAIDAYFDQLRDAHGGEARVRVQSGAGPLVPGEHRQLRCVVDTPPTAKSGRSYVGSWQLGNTAHTVLVETRATKGSSTVNGQQR